MSYKSYNFIDNNIKYYYHYQIKVIFCNYNYNASICYTSSMVLYMKFSQAKTSLLCDNRVGKIL